MSVLHTSVLSQNGHRKQQIILTHYHLIFTMLCSLLLYISKFAVERQIADIQMKQPYIANVNYTDIITHVSAAL